MTSTTRYELRNRANGRRYDYATFAAARAAVDTHKLARWEIWRHDSELVATASSPDPTPAQVAAVFQKEVA